MTLSVFTWLQTAAGLTPASWLFKGRNVVPGVVVAVQGQGQVTEFLLRSGAWDRVDTGTGGTVGTPGQP